MRGERSSGVSGRSSRSSMISAFLSFGLSCIPSFRETYRLASSPAICVSVCTPIEIGIGCRASSMSPSRGLLSPPPVGRNERQVRGAAGALLGLRWPLERLRDFVRLPVELWTTVVRSESEVTVGG